MNDPRYERDAAYDNDIMRKLELSDIDLTRKPHKVLNNA